MVHPRHTSTWEGPVTGESAHGGRPQSQKDFNPFRAVPCQCHGRSGPGLTPIVEGNRQACWHFTHVDGFGAAHSKACVRRSVLSADHDGSQKGEGGQHAGETGQGWVLIAVSVGACGVKSNGVPVVGGAAIAGNANHVA